MQQGRGGMGSRKHGRSGCRNGAGKSPKARLAERMEAEKNERKTKKTQMFATLSECMEANMAGKRKGKGRKK